MRTPIQHVAINPFPGSGEVVVLFAGDEQTYPGLKVGPQVHDYHLIHYIVDGGGTFQCLGQDYELSKADSFFIHSGELVQYEPDPGDPWHYRWIGLRGAIVDQLLSQIGVSSMRPIIHSGANRRIPYLFRRINHVLNSGEPSCDLEASAYMRLLFVEYAKHSSASFTERREISEIELHIERVIQWLTLHHSQTVAIDNIARDLGYHRTYLSRMFKYYTGKSPMQFLMKVRMERAKQLLLVERLSVEEVASSVGFKDALYFSKQFKKWFLVSPTEFRMNAREP